MSDAMNQLDEAAGEPITHVVFGAWGWDGFSEPEPSIVPEDKRGVVLERSEAEPLCRGWSCFGGYGAPNCYALRAWSENVVCWITQYDGSTSIDTAPRHPIAMVPDMPGG